MIIWYGIGLDALALAIVLVYGTFTHRWARHDGYQAGLMEGRSDRAQQQLAEQQQQRHEARHAHTRPRQQPGRTTLVQQDRQPPRDASLPGPGRPQPPRDPSPATGELPTATTGELAAVTHEYIATVADAAATCETLTS